MDVLKGCLSATVIGIVVAVVVHQIWGGTVLVGLIAGPIVIFALYLWLSGLHARQKFVRAAPGRVQECMEAVKESLAAGDRHLETAERELESEIAPLFWDAMDNFPLAIDEGRKAWNEAVEVVERYERQSPRNATPLVPDASLPAMVVELGGKWLNLRRRSLANQHFASIFEQRRQADKIADHLKKQRERIETAIDEKQRERIETAIDAARRATDAARRAEQVASQAHTAAEQAGAKAGSALRRSSDAKSVANEAIRVARWSKI